MGLLRVTLCGFTLLVCLFGPVVVSGQLLKLKVEPAFEFVNENWTIGRALPSMSVCVQYSGARSLSMVISSGDPFNYFRLSPINDTCWSLILQKGLDADIVNSDGSRGQSFSLAFRCSDGKIQAYGNADVQVVDINDNAPRFVDTKSAVSVPEDAENGKVIFTVSTFDPDTGVGGINSFMLEDDFKGAFRIKNGTCFDSHCTAEILLNSKLNYDLKNVYTLTIVAFDGAGRSKTVNEARFPVVVTILDVENNPPKFLVDNRVHFVPEDAPIGSEVFHVFAYDGDPGVLQPRPIVYSLQEENEFFGINTTSGWVYVKRSLDRETSDVLKGNGAVNLVILAEEDTGTNDPKPTSSINMTVIISDVDDEPPRCNLTRYTAQVVENSQRFVPITLTNAQELYVFDNDEGINGEFHVSLLDHEDAFDVNPKYVYNVGNVLIRVVNGSAIDYETRQVYEFKVVLTPAAPSAPSSSVSRRSISPTYCDVTVVVLDANDNPPQFNKSFMEARVPENQPVGTLITTVNVYDIDTPQFLPIVFKLSGSGSDHFYIDPSDNGLKTSAVLDREKRADYQFTVTAVDENGRGNSNTATIRVDVDDQNDNAPEFAKSQYIAYLPENDVRFFQMPNGFFIEATDADEPNTANSNITYALEADAYGAELFQINPTTGQLAPIATGVDLESMTTDYFNFTVIAQDQAEPALTNSTNVLIYVNDTNDNAPIFSQSVYTISVYENVTAGTPIVDVSATDADRSSFNSLLAYRIVDVQDKFTIDSQTGRVVLADGATLDRDQTKRDRYRLSIVASDQGVPPQIGRATIEVTVVDINDKPPRFNEKLYTVRVYENAPVGTFLLNVTGHDSDTDAKLVYALAGFSEAKTDDGAKVDITSYDFGSLFEIVPDTGQVLTRATLDREQLERVIFLINVTDQNGIVNIPQTAQTMLEIIILDVNDNAPQFTRAIYAKSMPENAEIGSIILTVTATDKDKNRSISYSIEEDQHGNDTTVERLVDVGATTGEITVASTIDFEQIQWVNVTVIATDSGVPPMSNSTLVSIRVLDQNDNSPVFTPSSSYSATLSEDSPPGTFVVRVSATDADSGSYGRVSYFLLNDLETNPHFAINETSGVVSVLAPLDREIRSQYSLTVRAVDDYAGHVTPGSHESTAVVRVSLTDVNDNAPEFVSNIPKMVALTENNAAGALVMTLAASDKDDPSSGNGQIRFGIVDGNGSIYKDEKAYPLFTLNSTSGALRLAVNLTGLNGLYWLTVEARDSGTPEPLATRMNVTIKIQDYNDHKPVIVAPKAHAEFHATENNFSDYSVIARINAVDADEGVNAELHYSLKQTSTSEDWKYFRVESISGEVYPKQAFDYERQNRYELTAVACDLGQPSLCDEAEFSVVILDENDNCPSFKRPVNFTYELEIKENQPADSVVGSILEALDKDTSPENVRVCYEIIGGDDRALFRMAATNGTKVLTTGALDREQKSAYELIIRAADCRGNDVCSQGGGGGSEFPKDTAGEGHLKDYHPADLSLLLVRVNVLDDNDHDPFFLQHLYRGGVHFDTKIGSRVARVRAEDQDIMDAGHLRYSITAPIKANLHQDTAAPDFNKPPFVINETTGDIISNILFQPSWKGTFEIPVGVKDLAGHTAGVMAVINLLRFDQQLELIFEAPVNQVWDEAHDIIKYMSLATNSNATIDDVLPYESYANDMALSEFAEVPTAKFAPSKRMQSKVLVHFVDVNQDIVGIDSALQFLDRPRSIEQKQAKHHLISVHHLRYAGQNSDPTAAMAVYKSDAQTLTALAGVVGGLVLVMSVLIATWCIQMRTYKRKLKAAATLAFSATDMIVPAYDLPGTNLHANSNPVWSPDGGHFAFENDDRRSHRSSGNDSLDDNDLAYQIDKASRDSPRTVSTAILGSQVLVNTITTAEILKITAEQREIKTNGARFVEIGGRNGNHYQQQQQKRGPEESDEESQPLPPPPIVTLDDSRTARTLSPQPPNFPKPLLSSLESTEL